MATNPVVLILGSGPRIGTAVAKKFAGNGYKVAIVSRNGTGTNTTEGYLSLKADFAKPDTIPALFETIKKTFQTSPSVVIYNAGSLTPPPVADDIFSVPAERVESDLVVNAVSPYVAAQQAVSGWKTLPEGTKKTFIYTGNITNVATIPVPLFLNLGIGKSAASSWVGLADVLYSKTGVRFFYTDERYADGKLKGGAVDGDAHADFYEKLAEHEGSVPWHATFVKDQGYVEFPGAK